MGCGISARGTDSQYTWRRKNRSNIERPVRILAENHSLARGRLLLDWRVRRLIINADDFGLTAGVNRAIGEAHTRGVVTSATLMANGAAFDEAGEQARSAPAMSVGCHVVLLDGRPLLQGDQISSLMGASGSFRQSWGSFAAATVRGKLLPAQIEAEATAQIRKLQAAGIAVSHLDAHKHAHIFPQILQPVLRAAQACGVTAIRNPFERLPYISLQPGLWTRVAATRILNRYAAGFRRMAKTSGLRTTDGCVGIVATGFLTGPLLDKIVANLPEGTWELVSHPGYADAALQGVHTRLRASREGELGLLTSPQIRETLSRSGVELISYRDLG